MVALSSLLVLLALLAQSPPPVEVSVIEAGETVHGKLTAEDLIPDKGPVRRYQFVAPSDGSFTVSLESWDFDALLVIETALASASSVRASGDRIAVRWSSTISTARSSSAHAAFRSPLLRATAPRLLRAVAASRDSGARRS